MEDETPDGSSRSQQPLQTEQPPQQDALTASLLALGRALQQQQSGTMGSNARGAPRASTHSNQQQQPGSVSHQAFSDTNQATANNAQLRQLLQASQSASRQNSEARIPTPSQTLHPSRDDPWTQVMASLSQKVSSPANQQPAYGSQQHSSSIPPEIVAFARQIAAQHDTQRSDTTSQQSPAVPRDVQVKMMDSKLPASSHPTQESWDDESEEDESLKLERDPPSRTQQADSTSGGIPPPGPKQPSDPIRTLATRFATIIQQQQEEAARKEQKRRQGEVAQVLMQALQSRLQPAAPTLSLSPPQWYTTTAPPRPAAPSAQALSAGLSSLLQQFNISGLSPAQMEMQQRLAAFMTSLFQVFISYAQTRNVAHTASLPDGLNGPLSTAIESLMTNFARPSPPSTEPRSTSAGTSILPTVSDNGPAAILANLLQQHTQQQQQQQAPAYIPTPTKRRMDTAVADQNDDDSDHPNDSNSRPGGRKKKRIYRHESFPMKLHRLLTTLEADGQDSIVGFVEDGTAFRIHQPDLFEQEIIPKYFRHTKLRSFSRQLNMYGFQRIAEGANTGAFAHTLFLKDRPELCKGMERVGETSKSDKDSHDHEL